MVKWPLAAGVIAAVFTATPPVTAQPTQQPSVPEETALIGLSVYSSEGQKLGEVTQASMADNAGGRFRQLPRHWADRGDHSWRFVR